MAPAVDTPIFWPIVVYFGAVLFVVGVMVGLSYVLGERHRENQTDFPFESGIKTTGDARGRLSAQFYLIAMLFVIFDLETMFIISWAVAFRELGWAGYIEILVFIVVLLVALVYLWRLGALDWGPATLRKRQELTEQEIRREQMLTEGKSAGDRV